MGVVFADFENSLGMALSKAKSGSAWKFWFWQWNLVSCSRHEAPRMTQVDKVGFCLSSKF